MQQNAYFQRMVDKRQSQYYETGAIHDVQASGKKCEEVKCYPQDDLLTSTCVLSDTL